jgi:CAAX protease family protein
MPNDVEKRSGLIQDALRFVCQPHVLPYVVFLVITQVGGYFGLIGPVVAYPVKLIVCAALAMTFIRRGSYPELGTGLSWRLLPIDLVLGVAVFGLWIAPESIAWLQFGGSAYNPNEAGEALRIPMIVIRLMGAVILVPVIEELFMRSFLPRFIDTFEKGEDWRTRALGSYTIVSFVVTAILFGLAHHRWAVGIATGLIYNGYFLWRRSLWPIILVHAVTNLALGIYVLETGHWTFW